MRFSAYVPIYLSISTVLICTPVLAALSPTEVNQIAKAITVRIEDDNSNNGSGIIVKQEGKTYYVLTAYHVVNEPNRKYTIVTPDAQTYPLNYKSVRRREGIDLAVIEFESDRAYKVAQIGDSNKVTEGSLSFVAGFPRKTSVVNAYLYRFLDGRITANATQALDEGYAIVYSNNTIGGMSGGPVLNDAGEVIAVHGRAESIGEGGNAIRTGNNLGIPIKTFLSIPLVDVGLRPPRANGIDKPRAANFYLQGVSSYAIKDYPKALLAYTEAIKLNPNYAEAYLARANVYSQQKKYVEALKDLDRSLKLNANNKIAYSNRGLAYTQQKNYVEALADYNRALELDSNYALAYNNRGSLYREQRNYVEALADYNRALELDPNLALAYNNRGFIYSEQRNYGQALANYNRAIKLEPNFSVAYINRGFVYNQQKRYDEALSDYNRAIKLEPNSIVPYIGRGFVYNQQKKYAEALSDYNRAIKLEPNFTPTYINRGAVYSQQKKYAEALSDYNRAIQLSPNFALGYNNRGFVQYELRNLKGAIEDWRTAISIDPKLDASLMGLAIALYVRGERSESFKLAEESLKLDKRLGDLRYLEQDRDWGNSILEDAKKFWNEPEIQQLIK